MRRFIAFIVLAFSMLALVLFNVQATTDGLNWSQEYDKGTEVVYNISVPDEEGGVVDINHVIKVMGDRLEDAGATNYNLESVVDEAENRYEVRVILGSRNSYDVDNILRSTMAAGEFSVFTTDGMEGATDCIIRNSAEVLYNENHEAYIRVETTADVQSVVDKAKEDNGNSLLVLWQNKTEEFEYEDLADDDYICESNNLTSSQLRNRVLAVINIGETVQEEGQEPVIDNSIFEHNEDSDKYYLTFKAFGYSNNAESTTPFNANSAHSFERILNSEFLDYDITEVYRISAFADYGNNASTFMIWAAIAIIVVACAYTLIRYGLLAVSGCIGNCITIYGCIALLKMFNLIVSPSTILAILVTLGMTITIQCFYYHRTKEEAYRGRAISKASNDAFHRTLPLAVDQSVLFFILGIVLAVIASEGSRTFGIFLIESSILSILFSFLLPKFLNNFLLNSSVSDKAKLFGLKKEYIADFDGNREKEIPQTKLEKIEPEKHGKKVGIGALVGVLVATASIVGFSIASETFNYSNQGTIGRIEIRSAETKLFETVNDGTIQLTTEQNSEENFVYYLENIHAEDGVKVTKSWTVTNQKNPYEEDKNYIYFYADLEKPLAMDTDTFTKLEEYVLSIDNSPLTTMVVSYQVDAGVISADFNNTLVMMSVAVSIALVYFIIRYRYSIGLSSFILLVIGTFISVGLLSLTRLENSVYLGVGILAGLLLNVIFTLPLGNRWTQIKNESKVKVTTFDQRKEISKAMFSSTINQYAMSIIGGGVLLLVLMGMGPYAMLPIYGATLISTFVNGLLMMFGLVPLQLWFEKHFKFKKAKEKKIEARKAQRARIAKANRNKGAEPEEIIIPGIND